MSDHLSVGDLFKMAGDGHSRLSNPRLDQELMGLQPPAPMPNLHWWTRSYDPFSTSVSLFPWQKLHVLLDISAGVSDTPTTTSSMSDPISH